MGSIAMEELILISKLVKMVIFGTHEDIPACVAWPKLFVDAGINGVSAICYDAVNRLPSSLQPDFNLMLRWDLSAQGLRERYLRRHDATRRLHDLLTARGIDMLLLKGETLADYYPQPDLRECGDVDFVSLPDIESCNDLLESLGINLDFHERKHCSFEYGGVHFENHTFEPTGGYNRAHHRTFSLLRGSLPDAVRRADGCLELAPAAQAVFVVKHTAQHICYSGGRIALRMLLDLALLLRSHPEILNEWEPKLRHVGLWRFSQVMLCATDRLLGTSFCQEWPKRTCRSARQFIRLFLTESNRTLRYFAKFAFLPLLPHEILLLWAEKIKRSVHKAILLHRKI